MLLNVVILEIERGRGQFREQVRQWRIKIIRMDTQAGQSIEGDKNGSSRHPAIVLQFCQLM